MPDLFDEFGRPKRVEAFGGAAYCNVDIAIDNTVRRFVTEPLKLRDVLIQVHDNAQSVGHFDLQDYIVQAGDAIGFTKLDLSTLYFTNTNAGQNGTVIILGVRE